MDLDVAEAADLLAETARARRLARRATRGFAFPFLLYGAAALGAAGIGMVLPAAVGPWWLSVGTIGGVVVWRHYRTRVLVTGISAGRRRYVIAWGAAAVGFGVVFALAPLPLLPVLPWGVVGVTYLGLGATGDGPQMLAAGAGLCVVAATPLAGVPVGVASDGLAGGLLLAAGLVSLLSARWMR